MGKQITDREKQLNQTANAEIKKEIKSEMLKYDVTVREVADRLTQLGRPISEQGLRNAISNGTHNTTWYWDLMRVIRQS